MLCSVELPAVELLAYDSCKPIILTGFCLFLGAFSTRNFRNDLISVTVSVCPCLNVDEWSSVKFDMGDV